MMLLCTITLVSICGSMPIWQALGALLYLDVKKHLTICGHDCKKAMSKLLAY